MWDTEGCCRTLGQRIKNAIIWTIAAVVVFGAILGILYAVGGQVAYDTTLLVSGLQDIDSFKTDAADGCFPLGSEGTPPQCNAVADGVKVTEYKSRPSFVIFIIAVASILGWVLLMVMGGVGLIALPLDMILACAPAISTHSSVQPNP
jgi:LMBR1 domain-containing protein 1